MGRLMQILLLTWIKPQHFVLFVALSFIVAFASSYAISVSLGHVSALFPYISDTGSRQPESSVFGFFLCIGAGSAMTCMFIRHRHFADYSYVESSLAVMLNDVALFFGFLTFIGILLVANFQESSVLVVHMIGAILCFGFGVIYSWLHAYLTYKEVPFGISSKAKMIFRFILSVLSTIFFISTMASASYAKALGKNKNETLAEWMKSDKGYDWHLISTFSEWLMAVCFVLYFFTFYSEFRKVRLHSKIVRIYGQNSSFMIGTPVPSPVEH